MAKKCNIRLKGGVKCGQPLLPGKKYCLNHIPKKVLTPTTYQIGKSVFEGGRSIEPTEYHEYLASPEWREKAAREKERNSNCSLCNRKEDLHVHHRTYVRCGQEREGDLIVLCGECHEMFHRFYEYKGKVGHFVRKDRNLQKL